MTVVAMLQGTPETDVETTRSALAMAKMLGRDLTGLCALPDPQAAVMVVTTPESTGLTAAAAANIMDLQKEMLEKAEAAFREGVGAAPGMDCTFVHQVATAEASAASAATLADAIIFPRSAAKSGEPLSIAFDYVMMDARLPLVLGGTELYKPGPVVIGWDGSNGAARALRFHTPLLRAAGEVIIAQNRKDAERDGARPGIEPGSLEDWLKRKGIKASVSPIEGEVSAALLALAKGSGATMLVAGAYGHSRIGERLFGGTSKRLLNASDAPALALAR
ncbi:universal stress protein [Hyphomonas sp. WL0036]|uniref:universal stress protein n=1 Tax=Hyphomonas sediminis TaxID=2866160 RepID=UPI001C814582|nr:universal stress protein [Hyphomonas sediminis]MBY9066834.1 universal stress protein [Hyphomonas sediminis]